MASRGETGAGQTDTAGLVNIEDVMGVAMLTAVNAIPHGSKSGALIG